MVDADRIFPGQQLIVPDTGSTSGGTGDATDKAGPVADASTYMMRSGDTIKRIASHFGVNLRDLVAANPQVANPDVIRPGQVIYIPAGGSARATSEVTLPITYGLALWLAVAKREMDTGVDEIGATPAIPGSSNTTEPPPSGHPLPNRTRLPGIPACWHSHQEG